MRAFSLLALGFSPPLRGGVPSARHGEGMDARVEATQEQLPDGALLYPGPLCGGEVGTIGPAGGIGTMPIPFRQHMEVLSKSPAPPHGLAAHGDGMDAGVEATQERLPDARQAPSGVAFSLVTFSWPRKRK